MRDTGQESGRSPPNGSGGLVIGVFDQAKNDIMDEVKHGLSEQEGRIMEKIESKLDSLLDGVADRVVSRLATRTAESVHDGSRPSDPVVKKRASQTVTADSPQVKKICVNNRRGVIPLLEWLLAIVVASMGGRVNGARHWLNDDVRTKLSGSLTLASSASGIETAMFAVMPGEKRKMKFQTSSAAIWSVWLRRSILTMLSYARTKVLTADPPMTMNGMRKEVAEEDDYSAPMWLLSLNTPARAVEIVDRVFDKMESKPEHSNPSTEDEVTSTAKKRKLEKDAPEVCAIKNMRAILMSWLNYRRVDGRAYLYSCLLFLVHKMSDFDSMELAREAGFEIVLRDHHTVEDADGAVEGMWNIQQASTESMNKARYQAARIVYDATDDDNVKALSEMETRFPGLSVRLNYKRRVERRGVAASDSNSPGDDGDTFWDASEEVSLHSVATGFLMELFKVGDSRFVLASSVHSLRAIHTIAIGLRGFLKLVLDENPSVIEKKALGQVTYQEGKPGGMLSLMMGLKDSGDGKDKTRREKLDDLKFLMPWKMYEDELKKREAEEVRQNGGFGPDVIDEARADIGDLGTDWHPVHW